MQIQSVGVIGCGIMGHGIAQVAAQAGCDVIACELDQAALDRGLGRIDEQLARAVDRGRLERADADATRGRIAGTLDYGDLAGCDLVIEAITESLEGKLRMWADVDRLVKPEAILASNTSSLPVVEQAARTGRPERFLGLHFFNPPQRMDLIEVIRCVTTSDETFQAGSRSPSSWGSFRCRPATTPASSSTACSCPTCSTPSARTRRERARSTRSTRP